MPLYEYRCGSCNREFESYRRPGEDNDRERCPSCGEFARRVEISLFRAGGGGGPLSSGGTSCGSGPRRSPFR